MPNPPDARRLAATALTAIIKQGVFATATLDRLLRAQPDMDPRDRALATEIVYGTLRTRAYLEQRLRAFAKRGLPRTETDLESHLLVAAYQLLFLDRVPAFAVVDAAVTAISELGGKQPGGFANAVLRKLAMSPKANVDEALVASAPPWLVAALRESVGEDGMRGLLGCSTGADGAPLKLNTLAPPPCVRLRRGAPLPDWLRDSSHGELCSEAYLVPKFGDLQQRPEWHAGHYVVQEEGAMFSGLCVGAEPGETILDACAGRGQKSSLLAELLGERGALWATDVGEGKLRQLAEEFVRLGLPKAHTAVVDWQKPPVLPADFPQVFDRILVDAPCSGSGTLRHRPEIGLRLKPADIERLATNSERILRNVATVAGPNTQLLFVVCSVLRRECEEVLERVSDVYEPAPIAGRDAPSRDNALKLLPHRDGTDGFFIAGLRLRARF